MRSPRSTTRLPDRGPVRRIWLAGLATACAISPLPAQVSAYLVPDTVYFGATIRDDLRLVVENRAEHAIGIRALLLLPPTGWKASVPGTLPRRVPAHQVAIIPLALSGAAPLGSRLRGLLQLSQAPGDTTAELSLPLLPDPLAAPESAATLTLATTAVQVGRQALTLHVLVTNRTERPVTVHSISALGDFIQEVGADPAAASDTQSVVIPPRLTRRFALPVSAQKRVRTGSYPVVVSVDLAWAGATGPHRGTLISTREMQVGLAGVSETLTALSVPTFFMLPGFLILATFGLLWKSRLIRGPYGGEFTLDDQKADYAVLSVTLSIVVGGAYWLLSRVDYLEVYGVGDVVTVWFSSLALGAGAYAGYWAYRRSRLPPEKLEPIKALAWLAEHPRHHDEQLPTEWGTLTTGDKAKVYRLRAVDSMLWVAPAITVKLVNGTDVEAKALLDKCLKAHSVKPMYDGLRGLAEGGKVALANWSDGPWPRLVPEAEVEGTKPEGIWIEEEIGP